MSEVGMNDNCDTRKKCKCGLPALLKTCMRPTPNYGRDYWSCARAGTCHLFEPVDEEPWFPNLKKIKRSTKNSSL